MMCWIKEACLAMKQSIRMLLKDRYTVVLLVAGMGILGAMLLCMEDVKTEKSKIAIGIADKDNSELSKSVADTVAQMELYEVITGEEKQLTELLKKNKLSAVCVIQEGFEQELELGKAEKQNENKYYHNLSSSGNS